MSEHYNKTAIDTDTREYFEQLNKDNEASKENYSVNNNVTNNEYQGVETLDLSLPKSEYTVGQEGTINQGDIKSVIDFDRISVSPLNAANGIYTKVNTNYWGDETDLTYKIINDEGVVLISENGVGLGYTMLSALNFNKKDENTEEVLDEPPVEEEQTYTASEPVNNEDMTEEALEEPPIVTSEDVTNYTVDEEIDKQPKDTGIPAEQIEPSTDHAYNPYDDLTIHIDDNDTETLINGQVSERRKVDYTDNDLYYMAQLVENEASSAGETGQVAVAEEIRNRVLSDDPYYKDTVTGVLDQGYTPWAGRDVRQIVPSQETLQICRDVLDGKLWVFGRDDVLSHASHQGTDIYQTQAGVKGSSSYVSFYYDNLGRTQTFYTSGSLTEQSKVS